MSEVQFEIRNLKTEDVPHLNALCDLEDWNYSEEVIEGYRKVTPTGFFVAVTKEGELLGHCGAVLFGEHVAKLILFIVKPQYRGKGVGKKLYDKTKEFLGDINIGLDAWPGTLQMYKRIGFKVESFEFRYANLVPKKDTFPLQSNEVTIVDFSEICLQEVIEYDTTLTSLPDARVDLLKSLFEISVKSSVAVKDGVVVGYGCCQNAKTGNAVGPLYANDAVIARMIWDDMIGHLDISKGLLLNIFLRNECSAPMLESCTDEIEEPLIVQRLYTHKDVELNNKRIFLTGDAEI